MLVDLNRIPDLAYIKEGDGWLRIGAMTRETELDGSKLVADKYPLLADTTHVVADPLVRNLSTLGGNLAHADPANDHPASMIAYRAEIVATGPKGNRTIPATKFFTGPFETALEHDELLTEIRIPSPGKRSGGAYVKMERKVGDFATAAVAAQVSLASDGTVEQVGLALTNVGPAPIQASAAEAALKGKQPDDAAIRQAAELASQAAQPESDARGSQEYKRALVKTLAVRALRRAVGRAQGG
jgi:carbon-monoxide dehydrogenase medium subunit